MTVPASDPAVAAEAAAAARAFAALVWGAAQAALLACAGHRALLLWSWWRGARRAPAAPPPPPAEWPRVTVQLPVYNERRVATRLLDAVAAFDYPRDRLEVQVLDDSTDETRDLVAAAAARHRRAGLDVTVRRRRRRTGYKAGALAAGLRTARGELVAVFDADFVPPSDFLRRVVPHFSDPRVGMVQARWGHLNRDANELTRAQAAMLDAHFNLEHAVRQARGLFFNFNGTAGVWRRACIKDAGGWSHDTLTEDLDLSYRAQLRGWRFVYEPAVVVPAELPADLAAFRAQQRRWARGSIQTARKLLPAVLAAPLPARVRLEACAHLTAHAVHPLLIVLTVLLPSVMGVPTALPAAAAWALQAAVLGLGVAPVALFLWAGQRAAGVGVWAAARGAAAAIVLGAGMSLHLSRAVLAGLAGRTGEFERTPKTGAGAAHAPTPAYRPPRAAAGRGELALALYAAALGAAAWHGGEWRTVPFTALLSAGFLAVGLGALRAVNGAGRACAAVAPAAGAGRRAPAAGRSPAFAPRRARGVTGG
uniref:Glycosyltransferase n=1 Tax=Eiseniibacteriota bacterium TaxID=2212470 RepID=A0A832I2D1_UNCEI